MIKNNTGIHFFYFYLNYLFLDLINISFVHPYIIRDDDYYDDAGDDDDNWDHYERVHVLD